MTNRARNWAGTLLAFAALGLSACSYQSEAERERNSKTAAGKTGKVAYKVSKEAGKAARAVGRELRQAAGQARDGWKEAAREDRAKHGK